MSSVRKYVAVSDIYTAVLALATGALLATTVYVVMECFFRYGTLFSVAK